MLRKAGDAPGHKPVVVVVACVFVFVFAFVVGTENTVNYRVLGAYLTLQ